MFKNKALTLFILPIILFMFGLVFFTGNVLAADKKPSINFLL